MALSQGKIAGTPDRFIDAAFADGPRLAHDSSLRRRHYIERAAIGGFAEAVRRTDRRRAAFFESYLDTLIKRDVQQISAIERTPQLRKLLQLLAIRSANLRVPGSVVSDLDIHRTTITRYLKLLETVFLVGTIPAWSGGGTHRAIGTPKLTFTDTGLLCHLLGQGPTRLADPGGAAGPVLENFVLMELARQLT